MAEIERMVLEDDVAAIVISGEFDGADESRAELAVDFVLGLDIPGMLVDLTRCDFIDSSGIRTLQRSNERALRSGTRVAIAGSNPPVERLLRLTGVRKRLAFFADREAALASLRAVAA